jgi:glycosyltransferase involved in cell wall biosynthesis
VDIAASGLRDISLLMHEIAVSIDQMLDQLPPAAPRISVVIATLNRRNALRRTLQTLFEQDLPSDQYEIIVVDDGSTDGTSAGLRQSKADCAFRVITQPNRGQAAARNAGCRASRGEIVLFLDDDMLCEPQLLREHLRAHEGSQSSVVFGPTPPAAESPDSILLDRLTTDAEQTARRLSSNPTAVFPDDTMLCSNTSLPRSLIDASHGYDERFFRWYEDIEYGVRLRNRGITFRYQPRARAFHFFVKSTDAVVAGQFYCGKNSVLLCRTHPALRRRSLLTPLDDGPGWKRWLRIAAIRAPVLARALLTPAFRIANRLRRVRVMRRAAILLHGLRCRSGFFRGAIEEAGSVAAYSREFGARLPILRYDHLATCADADQAGCCIEFEEFHRQMHWMADRGYTSITALDWVRWCDDGAELPAKPVLLLLNGGCEAIIQRGLQCVASCGLRASILLGTQGPRRMSVTQIRYWAKTGWDFVIEVQEPSDSARVSPEELHRQIAMTRSCIEAASETPVRLLSLRPGHSLMPETLCDSFDAAFGPAAGINDLHSKALDLRTVTILNSDRLAQIRSVLLRGHR